MRPPLWDVVQLSDLRACSLVRRLRDVLLVAAAVVLVVLVGESGVLPGWIPVEQAVVLLTLVSGAAALAIAVLWSLVARLTDDGRPAWAAAALALYGLIAVPATTLGSTIDAGRVMTGALRLSAHVAVALMLLVCALPVAREPRVRVIGLFWSGAAVSLCLAGLAAASPAHAFAVTTSAPVRWAVVAVWMLAGMLIAYQALPMGLSTMFRAGLGVMVLASAHGFRIATEPAQPLTPPALTFSGLRLLALAIVVLTAVQITRRALHDLGETQREHEEQLLEAEVGLARLAERDHELRNGIAGLAGATGLLRGSLDTEEERALRASVAAELARLDALLDRRGAVAAGSGCEVGAVVRDAVTLSRCSGMDVSCAVEPDLRAATPSDSLTQVLVNVLANCNRHASGSRVLVRAWHDGARITVTVADTGPGVPRGTERSVFDRGTRGPDSGGRGLGLHICREVLAAHGGDIRLHPGAPGCTVRITVPAATAVRPSGSDALADAAIGG